jgi:hypothetical protein
MRRLVVLIVFALSVTAVYSNDDGDKRLDAFLGKLEIYNKNKENKERAAANWNMPNANPETNAENMPIGNIDVSIVDHASGLAYTPATGKLFDPELDIELDLVTGIVYDFKTKKEYRLSDLQAERNHKL